MTYTIVYNPGLDVLEVCITGNAGIKESREIIQKGVELSKQHHCRRVLADVRKADLTFSILELFTIPQLAREARTAIGLSIHLHKQAIVANEYNPSLKFVENAMNNRGHVMKVFVGMDDAMKWLQS